MPLLYTLVLCHWPKAQHRLNPAHHLLSSSSYNRSTSVNKHHSSLLCCHGPDELSPAVLWPAPPAPPPQAAAPPSVVDMRRFHFPSSLFIFQNNKFRSTHCSCKRQTHSCPRPAARRPCPVVLPPRGSAAVAAPLCAASAGWHCPCCHPFFSLSFSISLFSLVKILITRIKFKTEI